MLRVGWFDALVADVRYGLRTFARSPGFVAVAVTTLALGIGASVAIFSFVDGVLLKPLPYEDADRIVRVLERPPFGTRNGISTLNFLDWQRDNEVFDFMAAQTGGAATLTGVAEPVQLSGARVSAHYFDIFGIEAVLGRTFLADEDQPGKERVVVLSNALWVSRFGADPSIVGRTILLDDQPHTVIGVLPAGGEFDRAGSQLWRPLAFQPANMTRNFHWLTSFGRLQEGVSLEQAQADMDTIGARIAQEFPDSNKDWGVIVERYADTLTNTGLRNALMVLMAAAVMLLLIGCANLASLSLARGLSRESEVAVRASLGAGRGRLARQFLTENVLLSVGGGLLGIGIGYAMLRWLLQQIPPGTFPREVSVGLDLRVLGFALAVSVLTGVLFGLAPALQATSPDLAGAMKEGGRGAVGHASRRRLRDVLVVAEIALAFVLLVGSALMMRSLLRLTAVDTGFTSTNVLTMGLPVGTNRFPDPVRLNLYLQEIESAVEAVPGVRDTAFSCAPPMRGACYGMPMQVASQPVVDRSNRQGGFFKIVSPSYFSTMGLTLIRGRALSDRDTSGSPPALVMDERLAARYFEEADPIGEHVLIQEIVPGSTELGPEISWEVVGVVASEKLFGLRDDQSAGVYVSYEQSPYYRMTLNVRTAVEPVTVQRAIIAAIHEVDSDQAVTNIRTVDEIKALSTTGERLQSILMGSFAAAALLLAAIGIYGLLSYSVAQRTRELGIRAALGATEAHLQRIVMRRGLILAGIGLVAGAAGALGLTRLMASQLYGIGPRDPATMTGVAVVLAAVAAAACYLPARRATKVDPLVALRAE